MLPDGLRHARRVLVVRLDNLGDVVLTAPFARALTGALPQARLTLLASPGGALAAPLLPWYAEVLQLRAVWQDLGGRMPFDPGREAALVERLRAERYDAAFFLTSFSQTPFAAAYAAYLAGIPVRVGHARDFGGSVLSHPVDPPPDGTHQAERNLHLLDALGIPVADRRAAVAVPSTAAARIDALLEESAIEPGEAVVIVPGASCSARRWPAERYAVVARGLAAAGRPVVVAGTEREAALAEPILRATPSASSLVGATSFPELAALIARAGVVLCGNSAALHLADAVGTPVVALYSGTDRVSEWAPQRTRTTLFRVPTGCTPCRRFDCPYELACLDVAPAAVVRAALALLDATPTEDSPCVASAS